LCGVYCKIKFDERFQYPVLLFAIALDKDGQPLLVEDQKLTVIRRSLAEVKPALLAPYQMKESPAQPEAKPTKPSTRR
jgi:hypothetical protein